jgi:hypothetical protein
MEEALLPGENLWRRTAAFHGTSDRVRFPGKFIDAAEHILTSAHALIQVRQLIRDVALILGETLRLLRHRLLIQLHGHERIRAAVQLPLLLREILHLLQGLLHARLILTLLHLLLILEQRKSKAVQILHRL